jgi:hypothetical protein
MVQPSTTTLGKTKNNSDDKNKENNDKDDDDDDDDDVIDSILDEYRKEMELRLHGQEKTYKLKLKFLKTKHKQRQSLLQQLIETKQIFNSNDIKKEKVFQYMLFG